MLKFRSMIENVVERLVGWLLFQEEARADYHCTPWESDGCCGGPTGDKVQFKRYCPSLGWQYSCIGPCGAT
jgi:hypothetical protein